MGPTVHYTLKTDYDGAPDRLLQQFETFAGQIFLQPGIKNRWLEKLKFLPLISFADPWGYRGQQIFLVQNFNLINYLGLLLFLARIIIYISKRVPMQHLVPLLFNENGQQVSREKAQTCVTTGNTYQIKIKGLICFTTNLASVSHFERLPKCAGCRRGNASWSSLVEAKT